MSVSLGSGFDCILSTLTSKSNQDLGDFSNLWLYLDNRREKLVSQRECLLCPKQSSAVTLSSVLLDMPELSDGPESAEEQEEDSLHSMDQTLGVKQAITVKKDNVPSVSSYLDKERLITLRSSLDVGNTQFIKRRKSHVAKSLKERPRLDLHSRCVNLQKKLKQQFPLEGDFDSLLTCDIISQGPSVSAVPIAFDPVYVDSKASKLFKSSTCFSTHIFIDSSNIYLGFQRLLQDRYPVEYAQHRKKGKMNLTVLNAILERGRPNARKVLVGSKPLLQSWDEAEKLGYEVSLLDRVQKTSPHSSSLEEDRQANTKDTTKPRYTEQGVDELIHLKMLETLLDSSPVPEGSETASQRGKVSRASTIVLATGDAALAQFSSGFFDIVQRALIRGWNVEVLSFSKSVSRLWRDRYFQREWASRFRIINLDDFLDELEE